MLDKDILTLFHGASDAVSQVFTALQLAAVEKTRYATAQLAGPSVMPRLLAASQATPKTQVKPKKAKKPGPKPGLKAVPRPCPVTGTLNTYRRFSYLMPEVRTAANLKKYKGWAKLGKLPPPAKPVVAVKAAPAKAVPAKTASAKKPVQKAKAKKKAAPKAKTMKKTVSATPETPVTVNGTPLNGVVTATVFHPSV